MKRHLKPLLLVELAESKLADCAEQQMPSPEWVKLVAPPDPMSYDEALLLTRQSEDEWLAWVPDHGEVTLHVSEFYFPHDWN